MIECTVYTRNQQQDTRAVLAILHCGNYTSPWIKISHLVSATGQNTHSSPTHLFIVGRSQAKRENNLIPCLSACKILLFPWEGMDLRAPMGAGISILQTCL